MVELIVDGAVNEIVSKEREEEAEYRRTRVAAEQRERRGDRPSAATRLATVGKLQRRSGGTHVILISHCSPAILLVYINCRSLLL